MYYLFEIMGPSGIVLKKPGNGGGEEVDLSSCLGDDQQQIGTEEHGVSTVSMCIFVLWPIVDNIHYEVHDISFIWISWSSGITQGLFAELLVGR